LDFSVPGFLFQPGNSSPLGKDRRRMAAIFRRAAPGWWKFLYNYLKINE